jgi:thioredoxin 1
MTSILEVKNNGAFKELLNSKLPVVVDYWASWCGPCLRMKPIFHKLAAKHSKVAKFASVNIDKHRALSKSIGPIPTFVVYSDGNSIGRVIGFSVFEKFESHILPLIKKAKTARDEASGRESWRQTTLTPRRGSK